LIFVTVGHQLPFDRLISLVDQWAARVPGQRVFAQIGDSTYRAAHLESRRFLSVEQYERCLATCDAVVAHAGIGTILQTLAARKPLLVFPRLSELGETRNDHQVGTARHFANSGQLLAAYDDASLLRLLDQIGSFEPAFEPPTRALAQLTERLRQFTGIDRTA
jgi:UDP-N-acetylglucosamine transferase subunit ALG13